MEKDHDQLVGVILMRMKPRQFENRCTHNKVHFVLSEQLRLNPFWSQPATLSNLGKGPRFIFVAGPLSTTEVLGACARLNYRMVRAFKHNVKRKEYECKDAIRRDGRRGFSNGPLSSTQFQQSTAERTQRGFQMRR